jgi:hypothetical protein
MRRQTRMRDSGACRRHLGSHKHREGITVRPGRTNAAEPGGTYRAAGD